VAAAAEVGAAVKWLVVLCTICIVAGNRPAQAQQRFALIVSGATGGSEYADQYAAWTGSFARTLTDRMKFDPAGVAVLSGGGQADTVATAANVRKAIAAVRARMRREDLLIVLLVGHGTSDGEAAKFNLVGPDLESTEWAALLQPLPGHVTLVNTTSASFPFIERLSGPRRIVISATDSAAQRFDTVFPEYFVRSFEDAAADLDKNGRVSVWEGFASASAAVKRHYQQRGQLSTERALLDDNGDGVGRSASEKGEDGSQATRTYLDVSVPGAAPTDEALLALLQRKALVEAELDELKIRRAFLQRDEYVKEFERIITELSRVSSELRQRGKT
jgi:hypothetical protein